MNKLEQFLSEQGITDRFSELLLEHHGGTEGLYDNYKELSFLFAFTWTKVEHEYWSNLNEEFIKYCE